MWSGIYIQRKRRMSKVIWLAKTGTSFYWRTCLAAKETWPISSWDAWPSTLPSEWYSQMIPMWLDGEVTDLTRKLLANKLGLVLFRSIFYFLWGRCFGRGSNPFALFLTSAWFGKIIQQNHSLMTAHFYTHLKGCFLSW